MNKEADTQGPYKLWINRAEQIVSFRRIEERGFEILVFSSDEERFAYVFEHCTAGFRFQ